jgi:glucokinase
VLVDAVVELRDVSEADVRAVGFGIPALIDRDRGVAVSAVHLPISELAFADVMAERLGLPVVVDNDANAAMLVEHRFGAAKGALNAAMLTIGTGIGGGLIIDGRLFRGARGTGAELGHMVIELDGPPCTGGCPNHGCLETMASGNALGREGLRVAQSAPDTRLGRALAEGREITGSLVTELAHDGDPAARDVVALIGMNLGVGLANIVNIFNPEVIVIGGGAIAAGELLLEPARQVMVERALPAAADGVRVVPARFGAESGMLGAATMAWDSVHAGSAA